MFLPHNLLYFSQKARGLFRVLKRTTKEQIRDCALKALDKNNLVPNILIIQAIKDLLSSWNSVSKETIINCLKKGGISDSSSQVTVADADDPFKVLTEDINHL